MLDHLWKLFIDNQVSLAAPKSRRRRGTKQSFRCPEAEQLEVRQMLSGDGLVPNLLFDLNFDNRFARYNTDAQDPDRYKFFVGQPTPVNPAAVALGSTFDVPTYTAAQGANASTLIQEKFVVGSESLGGSSVDNDKVLEFLDDSNSEKSEIRFFIRDSDTPSSGTAILRWDMLVDGGFSGKTGSLQFRLIDSTWSSKAKTIIDMNGSVGLFANGVTTNVSTGGTGYGLGKRVHFEWRLDLDQGKSTLYLDSGDGRGMQFIGEVDSSDIDRLRGVRIDSNGRMKVVLDNIKLTWVPPTTEQGVAIRTRAYQLSVSFVKQDLEWYKDTLDQLLALGYNRVTILPESFRALSIDPNGKVTFGISGDSLGDLTNIQEMKEVVQYAQSIGLEPIVKVNGVSKMGALLSPLLEAVDGEGEYLYENLVMDPTKPKGSGAQTINPFYTGLPGAVDPYDAIIGGLIDEIVLWYGSTPPSKIFLGSDENEAPLLKAFAKANASEYVSLDYASTEAEVGAGIVFADLFNRFTDYLATNYEGMTAVAWGDMFLSSRLGPSETERADLNDFWADKGPTPVSRWKLDGDASDSAGNNDGSLNGNPTWLPSGGVNGGAIDLDGSNDYISVPDDDTLDITDKLTLSAWVNPDDLSGGNQFIVSKGGSFMLDIRRGYSDVPHLFINDGEGWGDLYATSSMKLIEGQWNYIAATYDASTKTATIYVNGVSTSGELGFGNNSDGTIAQTSAKLTIGQQWGSYFDGKLDDVRVYDQVLTAGEIETLSINIKPHGVLGWQNDKRFLIDAGKPFTEDPRANTFQGAAYMAERPLGWKGRDGRSGSTLDAVNYLKNRNRIIIADWQYGTAGRVDQDNGGVPAYPSTDYFQRQGFADVWGATWYNETAIQNFSQYARDRLAGGMIATTWVLDWENSSIQQWEQPMQVNSLKYFSDPDFTPPTNAQAQLTAKWGAGSTTPTAVQAIHVNEDESIQLELSLPAGLNPSDVNDPKVWLYDRYGSYTSTRNVPFSKDLTWNSTKGVFEVTIAPGDFSTSSLPILPLPQALDVSVAYEYKETNYLVTQYLPQAIVRTAAGNNDDPVDLSQSATSNSLYSVDFSQLTNSTADNLIYQPGGDYGAGTFIVNRVVPAAPADGNNGGLNTNWATVTYGYPTKGINDEIRNNGMNLKIDFTLTGDIPPSASFLAPALFSSGAGRITVRPDNTVLFQINSEGAFWEHGVSVSGLALVKDKPAEVMATYDPNLGANGFGRMTLVVTQDGNTASAFYDPIRDISISNTAFNFGNRFKSGAGGGRFSEDGYRGMSFTPTLSTLPAVLHKINIQRLLTNNKPPLAVHDGGVVISQGAGSSVTIDVLANDADLDSGQTLSISAVTQGAMGLVTNNGTDITYTPNRERFGPDSFTYTISDGNGGFDTATVSVMVEAVGELESLVSLWRLDGNAKKAIGHGSDDGVPQGGVSYTDGAIGMAADFDGTSGYISVPDRDTLDITDKLTLSAWVNPDDLSSGNQFIVTKGNAFMLDIRRGGTGDAPHLFIRSEGAWKNVKAPSSMKLIQGQWNYVAATYDASTKMATLYVNGASYSQALGFGGSGEISITTNDLQIGRGFNNYFDGKIDEVRIYDRVLTEGEVAEVRAATYVSRWRLNGNSDDYLGSNNGSPDAGLTWDSSGGVNGGAIDLDGSSDYISVPDDDTLDITDKLTLSAWVNPDDLSSGAQFIVSKSGSFMLDIRRSYSDVPHLFINDGEGWGDLYATSSMKLIEGQWNYIAATYDASTKTATIYVNGVSTSGELSFGNNSDGTIAQTSAKLTIGQQWGGYFDGKLDDVRVYDQVLTEEQLDAMRVGTYVSRWKLDGNVGDYVGNNNGTPDAGLTWDSSGGVNGGAVVLDGSSDYISVPDSDSLDITDKLTLSAWVNPDDLSSGNQFIVGKSNSFLIDIRRSWSDVPRLFIMSGGVWKNVPATSSMKLIEGQWNSVAATYDASTKTATIYVNGVSRSQTLAFVGDGKIDVTTNPLQIGMQWDHYFDGKIDDVRIYNRVLDAGEITLLGSAALRAAGPEITDSDAANIGRTDSGFELLVDAATAYWIGQGADASTLAGIDIRVADLSSNLLGLAQGTTLWIDSNAAGYGWFVDQTPWDNSEFSDEAGPDGMDLFSVLVHEMGHLLDQDHDEDPLDVMSSLLGSGERLVNSIDMAFTNWWWLLEEEEEDE